MSETNITVLWTKKLQYICSQVYLNNLAQWLQINKLYKIIELQDNLDISNYYMILKQNPNNCQKTKQ